MRQTTLIKNKTRFSLMSELPKLPPGVPNKTYDIRNYHIECISLNYGDILVLGSGQQMSVEKFNGKTIYGTCTDCGEKIYMDLKVR